MQLDDRYKTVGITNSGERKEFDYRGGALWCSGENLISIDIPLGVDYLDCNNNKISELNIPSSIEFIFCENNKISELNIPRSVKFLSCDKEVKGLEKIDWECQIDLF